MRILYAGNGIIGALGLVSIFSNKTSYSSNINIYLLDDPNDSSVEFSLFKNYAKIYDLSFIERELIIDNSINFDLIVSVHWRKKIKSDLLEKMKFGGINLHPSLLPKYAGCSSLAWALLNKEKFVGFTWHAMESEFDNGDIILQKQIAVLSNDDAFSLWNRVNHQGILSIQEAIELAKSGKSSRIKQDLSQRTYYPRGFPSYDECLKINPNLLESEYKKASYFPKKIN